jgi:hypothetical protein
MAFHPRPPIGFRIFGILLIFAAVAVAADTRSVVTPEPALPQLNQKAVHDEYINGNFEAAVARIEAFRKRNPDYSRGDSIFIARHLAVILAADPRSVEAGKYWMHRLLLLSPDADLSGMYASEAIERMFGEVKDEDDARTGRLSGSRRKWLWIGAGGTAVAAGVAVWVLFSHASEGPQPTVVPVNL